MAKTFSSGLDEMIEAAELEGERIERNGDAAVLAGAAVAVQGMIKEVPKRTGGLSLSIGHSDVLRDNKGDRYANVGPTGFDPRGERYETIGYVQEYGRSDTPPNPWMARSVKASSKAVSQAMVDKLKED